MKQRIASEDFSDVKCQWLSCMAGTGLAGSGRCFLAGSWWIEECPQYENEDIYCSIEEWYCEWEFLAGVRPYEWRIGDMKTLWIW